MTIIGKALIKAIYGMSADTKLYTYLEGCSDSGRQGMSQVQRWGGEYDDGAITGAPAFRYGQQQTAHMFPVVVEQTLNYYPPPCELDQIVTAIIAACDPLNGRTDGVIFLAQIYNTTYLGLGFRKRQIAGSTTTYQPAQNVIVSAGGVDVAKAIYHGLFNSKGQRTYFSWQIGAEFSDAEAQYDSDSDSWVFGIPSTGGKYVAKLIELLKIDNLPSIYNVTYDTMV
ncbi:hypothetical protein ACHAP3_011029 [Botrytis cinerea]